MDSCKTSNLLAHHTMHLQAVLVSVVFLVSAVIQKYGKVVILVGEPLDRDWPITEVIKVSL